MAGRKASKLPRVAKVAWVSVALESLSVMEELLGARIGVGLIK